jgi:hypothetical protein
MARRRLFRKRTTWDVVKGNMHIVVTVGALLTMLYAWSGDPTPNHPAAFQAAADPVAAGTPAPESTSSLEELLPPASTEQPAAQAQATAEPPAAAPATTQPLTAPAAPVQPASQVVASPALPVVPAVARQAVAEASPQVEAPSRPKADTTGIREERRSAHAHTARAQGAQRTRGKPPVAMAKPSKSRAKPDVKVADRDPFSCAVRKKQPCF